MNVDEFPIIKKKKQSCGRCSLQNSNMKYIFFFFQNGNTPLHIACLSGQLEIVKYLVEKQPTLMYSQR